ncbi:hypothetical protein CABS03_06114 [Colletotrichum abscissum]|uniref:Uncharacterized protein n=2 Tax=Colletotrichum abscissum TaxID=1671311 RepID=A0A9P9XBC4_9PEZI|nr:hypothetical protein CABS02_08919 [Colletotrichum abscissum]
MKNTTTFVSLLALAASTMASPIPEPAAAHNPRSACPSQVNSACSKYSNANGQRQCRGGQWNCVHLNPVTLDGNFVTYTSTGVSCSKNGELCS